MIISIIQGVQVKLSESLKLKNAQNNPRIFTFMNWMPLLGCTKLIYQIKMPLAATTASRRLLNLEKVLFPCAGVN